MFLALQSVVRQFNSPTQIINKIISNNDNNNNILVSVTPQPMAIINMIPVVKILITEL